MTFHSPIPLLFLIQDISSISSSDLCEAMSSLPKWREEQALRFKHKQGRMECAYSYLLLCQALKQEYGIEDKPHFSYSELGKPVLVDYPNIHFNLSHCKKAVACVVADHEVGIDIECYGRYRESLARYSMNDNEIEAILSSPVQDTLFTHLWTQKEALFKLIGSGINGKIKQLLNSVPHKISTFEYPEKGYALSIAQYIVDNHLCVGIKNP